MRLLAFIAAHLGQTVQAPGGVGGECVDLLNLYLLDVLQMMPIRANAVDWRNVTIPGRRWVVNGATNSPPAGAIVVWGPNKQRSIGANGHIAIALLADAMNLVTCDQNWPDGSPVSLVLHDYGGVLGWFQAG